MRTVEYLNIVTNIIYIILFFYVGYGINKLFSKFLTNKIKIYIIVLLYVKVTVESLIDINIQELGNIKTDKKNSNRRTDIFLKFY